jgi:hypothetical protein
MSSIGAASGDVGYTPPLDAPNDDGVSFPVTDPNTLIVNKQWITGRPPNAPEFVPNATIPITVRSVNGRTGNWTETTVLLPVPNGFAPVPVSEDKVDPRTGNSYQQITTFFFPCIQFWMELKNLNRQFSNQYDIKVTDLQIEMMINLAAAAAP